jgi:hypothetical protein
MSRWFRFYAEAMRNPKVARLTDKEFRLWVELLAVAAENDGAIPCLDDLKHLLKRRLDHLSTGVERLISMGLIDALDDGYEPHHWAKFQYRSDVSTDRVHKHRAKRNVSETPPETDTEADTDMPPSGGVAPPENDNQGLKPQHVVEAWNAMAVRTGLPPVKSLTGARQRHLRTRIREYPVNDWTEAIGAIERSPFCRGENPRGWRADFDFLLQPKSFAKLIEGSYDKSTAR